MRKFLVAVLLCLPLLADLAPEAAAQGPAVAPSLSSPLYEGETRTYRVTGIPANVTSVELREGAGTTAEIYLDFFLDGTDGTSLRRQFLAPSNGSLTFVVKVVDDFSSRSVGDKTLDLELRMWPGTDGEEAFDIASLGSLTLKDATRPAGPPEVTISGGSAVLEGGNAVFTLTALPATAVTVGVSVTGSGGFAAAGQTGAKTVAIGADGTGTLIVGTRDDSTDEPDGRITATVSADTDSPVRWRLGSPATASVTVKDDDGAPDAAGVIVDPTALALSEGGTPKSYTIRLTKAPVSGETVTVTARVSPDTVAQLSTGGGAADREVSLTFDSRNWDRAQSVTVTPQDDDDAADGRARIVHAVSGSGDYAAVTARSVLITVEDDDEEAVPSLPLVTVTAGDDVVEGGTAVFTIRADPAPRSPLAVRIRVGETVSHLETNYVHDSREGEKTVRLGAGQSLLKYRVPTRGDSRQGRDELLELEVLTGDGYRRADVEYYRYAFLLVRDNDIPGVTASASRLELTESGQASYTLRLFTNPGGAVTVTPVSSDPAVATVSGPLTFTSSNWWRAQTVTVTATNDEDTDPGFTLISHRVSGYGEVTGGFPGGPVVQVLVNDRDLPATPVAFFASETSTADEGAGTQRIRVNLNPAPQGTIVLRYSVGGTAGPGRDFGARSGAVPVFFGQSHTFIEVPLVDDGTRESDETVVLTLAPGAGYTLGSHDSHTLTIEDNEDVPRISVTGGGVVEEGGTAVFTIRANPAPAAAVTVNIRVEERGGANHVSGAEEGAQTLILRAGQGEAAWSVPTEDLGRGQGPGSAVIVRLLPGAGYRMPATWQGRYASVGVRDRDIPRVTASASRLEVIEGAQASYTLRLGTDPGGTVTVTPELDDPRLATVSGALTFDSGNWNEAQTVTVTGVEDADSQWGRTAIGHAVSGYGAITRGPTVFVQVHDDEAVPAASFAAASSAAVEDTGARHVRVTLNPPPISAITLNYRVSGTAATGDDFDSLAGTLAVDALATGIDIPVVIIDDDEEEAGETLVLTLAAGEGYSLGNPASHTLTIRDNDAVEPQASFAAATSSAFESAGTHSVRVNLSTAALGALTLNYRVSGTAASGNDYEALAGTVTVDTGATGVDIPVVLTDDAARESDETIVLTLAAGDGYTLDSAGSHTLTILDDDTPPVTPRVSFAATTSSADESEGTHSIRVRLNPAPRWGFSLNYRVGGTATSGADYGKATLREGDTALFGSVAVDAGAAGVTIPVAIVDDDADETDETVVLTLLEGVGYALGSLTGHTLTIEDNDLPDLGPPAVSFAAAASSAVENAGTRNVRVKLSPPPRDAITLSYRVGGTATAGADYTALAGTVAVGAGATGVNIPVAIVDDSAEEGVETLLLTLTAGDGYTLESPGSHTLTINDNDGVPRITVKDDGAEITEGGTAVFTIRANPVPASALTVNIRIDETGGRNGPNYVHDSLEGRRTVRFAAGQSTATYRVQTLNNSKYERDEAVYLGIEPGDGYTLPDSRVSGGSDTRHGYVHVRNDDPPPPPAISIADAEANEGDAMVFDVTLSRASQNRITVDYATDPRTSADFAPVSGTLTFPAGATSARISVRTLQDSHDEGRETFRVLLSNAVGATIADGAATGTIVNEDPMPAAWLARFGRAVAEQALDGITTRMSAPRAPGAQGALAGHALSFGPPDAVPVRARDYGPGGVLDVVAPGEAFGGGAVRAGDSRFGAAPYRPITSRDLLSGSSFAQTGQKDASGGSLAFWGRASQASFDGVERGDGTDVRFDGTVTTGLLGADYARGRWLVGLALARSSAEGGYRDSDPAPPVGSAPDSMGGKIETSLTAAIPYASLKASERLTFWGAAGYGAGEVTLETAKESYKADTTWSMAATGLRGGLLKPGGKGFGLAFLADALWTQTDSEEAGPGRLLASRSESNRLRLGIEGSRSFALSGGRVTPRIEVGVRHDGGDAERGFGVEAGGGVSLTTEKLGLTIDLSGRALLVHEAEDFRDRGVSVSLTYRADPDTKRGVSFAIRRHTGGAATGGLEALFASEPLAKRAGARGGGWRAEAAWGLPAFGGRFTGSPFVAWGHAAGSRDYDVGWRLEPEGTGAPNLTLALKATRRERADDAANQGVGIDLTARW